MRRIIHRDVYDQAHLLFQGTCIFPNMGISISRHGNYIWCPIKIVAVEQIRGSQLGIVFIHTHGWYHRCSVRHVSQVVSCVTGCRAVIKLHVSTFAYLDHNLGCRTAQNHLQLRVVGLRSVVQHDGSHGFRLARLFRIGDAVHQECLWSTDDVQSGYVDTFVFLHHSFEIAQIEVFGFEHADIRCAVGYQIYPICLMCSKIASLGGQGDFTAATRTASYPFVPYFRFVFLENQHIKMADRDFRTCSLDGRTGHG